MVTENKFQNTAIFDILTGTNFTFNNNEII